MCFTRFLVASYILDTMGAYIANYNNKMMAIRDAQHVTNYEIQTL